MILNWGNTAGSGKGRARRRDWGNCLNSSRHELPYKMMEKQYPRSNGSRRESDSWYVGGVEMGPGNCWAHRGLANRSMQHVPPVDYCSHRWQWGCWSLASSLPAPLCCMSPSASQTVSAIPSSASYFFPGTSKQWSCNLSYQKNNLAFLIDNFESKGILLFATSHLFSRKSNHNMPSESRIFVPWRTEGSFRAAKRKSGRTTDDEGQIRFTDSPSAAGQYCSHFFLPHSMMLQSMIIEWQLSCHIIRQKSSTVFSFGASTITAS